MPLPLAARLRRRLTRDLARARRWDIDAVLASIAAQTDGEVGLAALHLATGRTIGLNADVPAPMASTIKVPLAIEVLARVDAGQLDLDTMVAIEPHHLRNGAGVITARLGASGVALSYGTLLRLAMVESDNTATDILFDAVGGATAVAARVASLGITDMSVTRTVRELMQERPRRDASASDVRRFLADRRDTATPAAMVALLATLQHGDALSPESTAMLLDIMRQCATGASRIRARLPKGVRVANKTGTFPRLLAADVGIVDGPGGPIALAVFVAGATASRTWQDVAGRGRTWQDIVIADLARATYDELAS